jgi:8-hydroxy-5-deazaflavin:NADPH oxidoreductase
VRIGVLGTGVVGHTLATKLIELGDEVTMGAREETNEKAAAWAAAQGERAHAGTFAAAAAFGEVVVNATSGSVSLAVLEAAGAANVAGKLLIDVSNPLDFSQGFPPTLTVANTDSVAERLQAAYPDARVVKTLNTVNASVMVEPSAVPGDHVLFVSGNDPDAKAQAVELLGRFGWPAERVVDLGDITTARGPEMYLALWVRLMRALGTPQFNIALTRAS